MQSPAIRPKGIPTASQFEAVIADGGYTVFDNKSGRPMTFMPEPFETATNKARNLNEAAATSTRALACALGAIEADDDPEMAALAVFV